MLGSGVVGGRGTPGRRRRLGAQTTGEPLGCAGDDDDLVCAVFQFCGRVPPQRRFDRPSIPPPPSRSAWCALFQIFKYLLSLRLDLMTPLADDDEPNAMIKVQVRPLWVCGVLRLTGGWFFFLGGVGTGLRR